jgi:hypothetical protein
MSRLLSVAALVAAIGVLSAAPPAASVPATTEQLAGQLGSEAFEEREAAMAALEKLGEAARPALEHAAQSANPEVSRRAVKVLTNLQRKADAADRIKPKTIKLSYNKVPLGTAINDLKSRTGINLSLDADKIADPRRMVTCETGDLPPWEAVAAFCQAAGLREVFEVELPLPKQERSGRRGYYAAPLPPPLADAVPVKLADGAGPAIPGSRDTAIRVQALPANFPKHRVYLGGGEVLFHFDVTPMPGHHFQHVAGIRIAKVVDDSNRLGAAGTNREPSGFLTDFADGIVFAGGAVALGFDGEMPNRPTSRVNPRIVPVNLRLGTPTAKKLNLLEGTVLCELSIPNQPLITIDGIAHSIGRGVDGPRSTKFTVVEAKPPAAKGGKAVLKVQMDQPPAWMNNRFGNPWAGLVVDSMEPSQPVNHTVKGYDAAGKPVRMTVLTNSETSADEFTVSTVTQYSCPDGLPVKVVLHGPKPVLVEVPFKLENVPLP